VHFGEVCCNVSRLGTAAYLGHKKISIDENTSRMKEVEEWRKS
jgi:hypothetical protein